MLLAEKLVNKAVRQTEDDARTSLSLPISLLSGTPLPTRIQVRVSSLTANVDANAMVKAIVAILEEVERLSTRVVDPSQASPTFLSAPR
jgi:U3 small nucleolar RNA-associated protein 10